MEHNTMTTKRAASGQFDVYLNGFQTEFSIVNGSLGLSGHGVNTYGITNSKTGQVRWIGTLQACKKILNFTLLKRQNGGA